MPQVLASRVAGLRLGTILAALFIPLIVLLSVLSNTLNAQLNAIEREIQGLSAAKLVFPLLIEAADGKVDASARQKLAAAEPLFADNDETAKSYAMLRTALASPTLDRDVAVDLAFKLLTDIRIESGIGADQKPLHNLVEYAVTAELPELVIKHNAATALADDLSSADSPRITAAVLALGEWQAVATAAQRDLLRIQENPNASQSLRELSPVTRKMSAYVRDIYIKTKGISPSTAGDLAASIKNEAIAYRSDILKAWHATTDALAVSLNSSASAFQKKRLYSGLLALSAALLSLFTAYTLFKSSLTKLDEMDTTQKQAKAAQVESEAMNKRLTQINSEIVHLNHELADKMRRLKDVQDELLKRGRLEQLGQLTATVAHELRNPLGAVRTSAFLLDRKIKGKGLGVEPQLQRINNGITRCDSIITQLLDFSRTKVISAQLAVLDDWLQQILEEEAKRLPAVIDMELVLGLEGIEVPFDQGRLQRAMINLVSNAAEAMVGTGDDPSKFAVATPKLRVVTTKTEDMAVITVSDNGPGIPQEIIEKIREPLFTTKSFGTGLGIPAVEQIANQHGGRLEIKSETGHGAHFSIYIPLTAAEERAA